MSIEIDISDCTQDPETCPAVQQIVETDAFCEQMEEFEKNAATIRETLGHLVTACVNGNCPGRNPQLAAEILRRIREA